MAPHATIQYRFLVGSPCAIQLGEESSQGVGYVFQPSFSNKRYGRLDVVSKSWVALGGMPPPRSSILPKMSHRNVGRASYYGDLQKTSINMVVAIDIPNLQP